MHTSNWNEKEYIYLARRILTHGERMEQRAVLASTGERPYCVSIFGAQIKMMLSEGFPLLTTKKMSFKAVIAELLWFISGSTNAKDLENMGARIWSNWADENGQLGPVYGKHWRNWTAVERFTGDQGGIEHEVGFVDQLGNLDRDIGLVIQNPNHPAARRLLMISYNPAELPPKAPPGCHTLAQFSVRKGRLDCEFYMRSADYFLGVPYNIASYAALTHLLCNIHDLRPGQLIVSFGDVHIYSNHLEQIQEQIKREPYTAPHLHFTRKISGVDKVNLYDFELENYQSHPALTGEVAI